jgi:hypothetical protein
MDETIVLGRRFGVTADTHDVLVDWPRVAASLSGVWAPWMAFCIAET